MYIQFDQYQEKSVKSFSLQSCEIIVGLFSFVNKVWNVKIMNISVYNRIVELLCGSEKK